MSETDEILQLALRLAREAGKIQRDRYETDIEIRHVGLRPGEKLKEEYLSAQEGLEKTAIGKVWVTRPAPPEPEALARDLEALRQATDSGNTEAILQLLRSRVPDYCLPPSPDRV